MDEIYNMRWSSIVAGLYRSHNSTILFETLQIDPGYIDNDVNQKKLEIIRKEHYIEYATQCNDYFSMFGIVPYQLLTTKIEDEKCIIPSIPEYGSWDIVTTQDDKTGKTIIEIVGIKDRQKKYKYLKSNRSPDAFNHFHPLIIKSECGMMLDAYRNMINRIALQNAVNERYLNSKPLIERITSKLISPASEIAYDHVMAEPITADDVKYEAGLNSEEIIEGKNNRTLPIGFTMSTHQYEHKLIYNIEQEESTFVRRASQLLVEPLDPYYSGKSSLSHSSTEFVEEQRRRKISAITLAIEDIVNAIQRIWFEIYKKENPNVKIDHGILIDIKDIILLKNEGIIDDGTSSDLAHVQTGLRRPSERNKKKPKITKETEE